MYVLFHSNEINVPGTVITLQRNVITASAYHYNSSCERTEVNSAHLSTCQKRLWKFTVLWWKMAKLQALFQNMSTAFLLLREFFFSAVGWIAERLGSSTCQYSWVSSVKEQLFQNDIPTDRRKAIACCRTWLTACIRFLIKFFSRSSVMERDSAKTMFICLNDLIALISSSAHSEKCTEHPVTAVVLQWPC